MIRIDTDQDLADAIEENAGQRIELEPGEYRMGRPAVIPEGRPTEIIGGGEWFTRIYAQNGGIYTRSPLKIRDLDLWRADYKIETPAFGIFAQASVSVSD